MSPAVELDVRTSIVELINWTQGETTHAVRVDYRPAGTRRWRHFNLIPEEGRTLEALVKHASLAAQMVHAGRVPGRAELEEIVDEDGAA